MGRKDRERFAAIKRLYPAYKGYRGPQPKPEPKPELKTIACTRCGRKRNVPLETEEKGFVCEACLSQQESPSPS